MAGESTYSSKTRIVGRQSYIYYCLFIMSLIVFRQVRDSDGRIHGQEGILYSIEESIEVKNGILSAKIKMNPWKLFSLLNFQKIFSKRFRSYSIQLFELRLYIINNDEFNFALVAACSRKCKIPIFIWSVWVMSNFFKSTRPFE